MKNAARLTDIHQCPATTNGVPHGAGPLLPPSQSFVLIGGLAAARVGDEAACAGPLDTITRGAPQVLIEGKEAARRGDSTDHGGVIMTGHPMVLIGGEMPCSSEAERIAVALNQIRASDFAKTPEGATVLAKLDAQNSQGKISYADLPGSVAGLCTPDGRIVVTDRYSADPDHTASELVHEGTHALYVPDPPPTPPVDNSSIDQETRCRQNQQDFYQEQKQSGPPDADLDERAQTPIRDGARADYPDLPEHYPPP